MLTLTLVVLYATAGIASGLSYRTLTARSQLGFKFKHWVLLGAAIGGALLFSRFVINQQGLFGIQPESAHLAGAILMAGGFILVAWLLPWLRHRRQ